MVALAEPKKKTKWTLNPRGKFWSNDDTKLGQKLLEKMGWSKGKGLGKTEQGDVDPIRLNYNTESKGMGFKGNNDEWVATKEEFDSLLGKLKESHAEDAAASAESNAASQDEEPGPSRSSLEVRSKHSRARVHYHKFVRGKDLSRYSAEDLSCILGHKKTKDNQKDTSEDDSQQEEASELGAISKSHGVTTIQGGNLNEYFASKMAKLAKSASSAASSKASLESEALDEVEKPAAKKRRKSVIFNEEALVEEFVFNQHSPLEKKKKRKKTEDSDALDEPLPEPSKKKKKVPTDGVTDSNEVETVSEENVDQNTVKGKKKKKSLLTEDSTPINEVTGNQEGELTEKTKEKKVKVEVPETIAAEDQQISEVSEKKKKKKKRQDVEENIEENLNDNATEKKKKDKKQEKSVPEDQQPVDVSESRKKKKEKLVAVETNDVSEPTKKKKRKKDAVAENDPVEISDEPRILEQQSHEEQTHETCSVLKDAKRKKKEKKSKVKATSPTAEVDNNINELLESLDAASGSVETPVSTTESCESSNKKKKKKKTKAEVGSVAREQECGETVSSQETTQEDEEDRTAKGKRTKKSTSAIFNQRAQFKLKDFVPKELKDAVEKSVSVPVKDPPKQNKNSSQTPTFEYLRTSGIRPDAMNKIHYMYRQARFDLFVGSNLDSVHGSY